LKHKIVVLSGAGISAESGIKTFRDADGLWEGHDIMEVARPEGFAKNPALVLDFYNQRRKQLRDVEPNLAHKVIAELEVDFNVVIVTQNVDDLHERAGSSKVIHLHGELKKSRGVAYPKIIYDQYEDIVLGDKCEKGSQLRPHIVWFGEAVPLMDVAMEEVESADAIIIIGTSLQVYPAASLMNYASNSSHKFYIDKNPAENTDLNRLRNLMVKSSSATEGMVWCRSELKKIFG
jgi:NAD-dependent deacetylase